MIKIYRISIYIRDTLYQDLWRPAGFICYSHSEQHSWSNDYLKSLITEIDCVVKQYFMSIFNFIFLQVRLKCNHA